MYTLLNIRGDPNIGTLCLTTNELTLVPEFTHKRDLKEIKKILKTEIIKINTCGTPLNGCLIAGNSKRLLLPHTCYELEKSKLSENGIDFKVLRSRFTALGNLILANSNGVIVSPEFDKRETKVIESVLDAKTVSSTIAGLNVVGSAAVATDKGVLVHPNVKDEEIELLKNTLKVPVEVGTVNSGISFIRSGLLANNKGVVAGVMTTNQELIRITRLFRT